MNPRVKYTRSALLVHARTRMCSTRMYVVHVFSTRMFMYTFVYMNMCSWRSGVRVGATRPVSMCWSGTRTDNPLAGCQPGLCMCVCTHWHKTRTPTSRSSLFGAETLRRESERGWRWGGTERSRRNLIPCSGPERKFLKIQQRKFDMKQAGELEVERSTQKCLSCTIICIWDVRPCVVSGQADLWAAAETGKNKNQSRRLL